MEKWSDNNGDYVSKNKLYSCSNCFNPVARSSDILSKSFVATTGQAYMFGHAMNVRIGSKVEKQLLTGRFIVGDVYCAQCGEVLGWKYFQAHYPKQAYKESKFILELAKLVNQK